jgi:hypothetical protein
VAKGEELARFKGHTSKVSILAFSADCRMLVSGSKDKTITIWDVLTGKPGTCESRSPRAKDHLDESVKRACGLSEPNQSLQPLQETAQVRVGGMSLTLAWAGCRVCGEGDLEQEALGYGPRRDPVLAALAAPVPLAN